jgi:hypothetical protein
MVGVTSTLHLHAQVWLPGENTKHELSRCTDDVNCLHRFGFSVTGEEPPQDPNSGFLINPSDGYITGRSSKACSFNLTLYAEEEDGKKAILEVIDFQFKHADTDNPTNGPDGEDCNSEGGERVDAVLLDGEFSCGCDVGWSGVLCEKKEANAAAVAVAASLGTLLLLGVATVVMSRQQKLKQRRQPVDFHATFQMLKDTGMIAGEVDHHQVLEIPRSKVILIKPIGEGAFGEVWKAMLQSWQTGTKGEYLVAAKSVKPDTMYPEAANELVREAAVMAAVGEHPNVVSLIGVVTVLEPKLLLVSFCEHGSLHGVLRKRADGQVLNDLPDADYQQFWNITWSMEIAQGMVRPSCFARGVGGGWGVRVLRVLSEFGNYDKGFACSTIV